MTKLTIIDIARLAGVSTATVSRAMHSPHILRPATLERVQKAMKESGYVYNATAGDFSRRKSTVIGLLVISASTKISSTLKVIQKVATEQGFPLILSTSNFDPNLEEKHLHHFLERGVAGVLVLGHMTESLPKIQTLINRGIPCVFLWDKLKNTKFHYIGIDNDESCYAMTKYLIELGHRRIGFISGINAGVSRIIKRYNGYKRALADHGIPLDESIVQPATSSFTNGKEAMEILLTHTDPPKCVFCSSDALAMGALSAAYHAGINVPADMTIVGFDNSEYSAYTCPPLTTVDIPSDEIGRLAIQALMTLIANPDHPPIQKSLPTSLVVRGSSGSPKNRK